MTKTFKRYSVVWIISFIVFNVVTFASPMRLNGIKGNFLVGYIFITLAFGGQLICSYIAFKEKNVKKMFYNISLILISYISILSVMIIGTVCMIIPTFPIWLSVILCVIITGLLACIIIMTCFTINIISDIDHEIQTKTYTIKKLTMEAEHLKNITEIDELKNICKKVYEDLLYSDPMGSVVLSEINQQIQTEFQVFEKAIKDNDIEMAKVISKELLNLIDKRNKQCSLLK